ncbi:rhamnosyltransferase, partial [Pseudomonas syringae pv. tagetis]
YSLREEFCRYFDIGVFQSREAWIYETFGGIGREGMRYDKSELKFLGPRRILWWPISFERNALKLLAVKMSKQEKPQPR